MDGDYQMIEEGGNMTMKNEESGRNKKRGRKYTVVVCSPRSKGY